MSRYYSERSNIQYDPSSIKTKVNHHDFIETRTGIDDYTAFDLERFKSELMDKFIRDTDDIGSENDRVRSNAFAKIEDYESNHITDKDLNIGEDNFINQRKSVVETVAATNRDFDIATKEATGEKRKLREEIADYEDALRKARDQISETELENENFQSIVDAVKDIQLNQKNAEMNALRTINLDLKDQISRLEHELEFVNGPAETHNIRYGLDEKYKRASTDFNNFVNEAEAGKKHVEDELTELRKKVSIRKNENSVLQKDIKDNENEISRLNNEIGKLSKDIELLKKRNEDGIRVFEGERFKNEGDLVDLKKKAAEHEHEVAKLKILIEKSKNELDYLNSEKDKSKGQGAQKKLEEFNSSINDAERKTKQLKDELDNLNKEWTNRVSASSKLASIPTSKDDGAETAKRISMLNKELTSKSRELEDLKSQKTIWERELADDGASLDDKIQRQRDELDELNRKYLSTLEEKNNIYEELSDQAKRLLAFNDTIQKNAEQIAIQKQEIEFLKKELEQRAKLAGDAQYASSARRDLLFQLREEVASKNKIIDGLEDTKLEADELDRQLRDKESIIRELEAQVRNKQKTVRTVVKDTLRVERSSGGDKVDEFLAEYLEHHDCPVPIQKISEGNYLFGTRKIFAKIMNGKLVVRVGGGYMGIDEFIESYGQSEYEKMELRRSRGQNPFDDTIKSRSSDSSKSPVRR